MVAVTSADNQDSGQSRPVSASEPCLICAHTDWCFQVFDFRGDLSKIICGRAQPGDAPDDWECSGNAKDGRNIFVKKGYRRKKRKNRQYPELIRLTPSPQTDIPGWQNVVVSLEQLSKGHTVRLKPGNPGGEALYEVKKLELGKRSGANCLVAILSGKDSLGGTLEIAASEIQEIVTSDPDTGAREQYIEYYYSDSLKVVRTQWSDRRSVYPGKKNKKVRPWHKVGDSWTEGKGKREFPLYRESDTKSAIRRGEMVFAVAGEQAADTLAGLGLAATTNQGGEAGASQIALDLAPIFQEVAISSKAATEGMPDAEQKPEVEPSEHDVLKPLLVIWGDNDPKGSDFANELHRLCLTHRICHVILDPLLVWSGIPKKGDCKDWVDWCRSQSMSDEEILIRLELAIEAAIDSAEEDCHYRLQRNNWNAPTSWKGEIGKWIQSKEGNPYWQPCCNFDFQIERELQDSLGGGLVLQVKRHFENADAQKRVILNSIDYTSSDKFVNAMKRALGTGICCNLTNFELNQLFAVRLHEYRTSRRGKVLKRIECYGQQEDGTWVFSDRQFTREGQLISEDETGWVFSNVSAEGDEIPSPELAPPNPKALNRLVDTARLFFGNENIHQFLLTIGWVIAGLHSQEIFKDKKWFPLLNMHGEPGSCKTLAGEAALSIVGSNWASKGMVSRASVSAIYEHGSKTGSLPFIWDDPSRNPETEEIFKTWANRKARSVRGNRQEPKSPLGSASNHVIGGDQAATYTRMVRLAYERAKGGDNSAFTELLEAQKFASGALPSLLQLGYPKAEIALLEKRLLQHLPKAHARIAQALALVVCYAQKVVEISGGNENILQWAIAHLCPAEDDADSAGDSLVDFISKLQALEAIDEIGDWNKRIVTDNHTGQKFVAIYATNAWKMVDLRFKPATYNEKSLKVLIDKAGGKTHSVTLKFAADKAQVITYYNALITPRNDSDGNPLLPNKPRTANRKAWLIPLALWGEENISDAYGDDNYGGDDYSGGESHPDLEGAAATAATSRYQTSVAAEVPVESPISAFSNPTATAATSFETERQEENSAVAQNEITNCQNRPPNFSSVSVAAQDVSPISPLAATSPAVAAKKFANVQELVNQILLCRTWIDLVETVGENASLLKTATKTMTHEERRGLPRLLADYLCFDPTYLTKLSWVPVKLRDKALQPLTFTIQRLGGTTGSVLDACIEYVSGCKFVSVIHPGTRQETWTFQTSEGMNIPVFDVEDITAISLTE
jgi:hypothetical protein